MAARTQLPSPRGRPERRTSVVLPLLVALAALAAVAVAVDALQDRRDARRLAELAPPARELEIGAFLPPRREDPTEAGFEDVVRRGASAWGGRPGLLPSAPTRGSRIVRSALGGHLTGGATVQERDALLAGAGEVTDTLRHAVRVLRDDLDAVARHAASPGGGLEEDDVLRATGETPVGTLEEAVRWRMVAARVAAADGDAEGATEELRQALAVWRVPSLPPTLLGHQARMGALELALELLPRALDALPDDADVAPLARELEGVDPRAMLQRALRAERALLWTAVRRARGEDGAPPLPEDAHAMRWQADQVTPRSRARLLELFAELLSALALEDPAASLARTAELDARPRRGVGPVPQLEYALRETLETAARLELARLLLLARTDGLDAAERAAAGATDPLSGQPVRAARAADGALELEVGALRATARDRGVPPQRR